MYLQIISKKLFVANRINSTSSSSNSCNYSKKCVGFDCPRMLASCPLNLPSRATTLIIYNEEMNEMMKIVKIS